MSAMGAVALGGEGASGHLELLRRVTEQMTVHRRLEDVLGAITCGLVAKAEAALARIWLWQEDAACAVCRRAAAEPPVPGASSLHLCASAGVFDDLAGPHHAVPLGMFLGGRVAEAREPLLVSDLSMERAARNLPWIAQHGLRGYAGYPLLFDGQLEGVLGIFRRRPWTTEEFRVLSVFAAQAAIAIKTAASSRRWSGGPRRSRARTRTSTTSSGGTAARRDRRVEPAAPRRAREGGGGRADRHDGPHPRRDRHRARSSSRARSTRARRGADRPLVKVNCGAISPALVESELFGHEKGAFTGALQRRLGRFELADGGTLFLDEVGELPLDVQAKLLRVPAGRRVRAGRRAGADPQSTSASSPRRTATSQADVAAGRFRADLYYRLNVFPIAIPPLRERLEDVPLLASHFLAAVRGASSDKPLAGLDAGERGSAARATRGRETCASCTT